MTDRLTCCPHCDTSFRITEEQLQTAKGAVRCGSCLRIFKALDHLVAPTATTTTATARADEAHPNAPQPTADAGEDREAWAELDTEPYLDDESLEDLLLDEDINLGALDEELDEELEDLLSAEDFNLIDDTQSVSLGDLSDSFQGRGRFGEHRGALFDRQLKIVDQHTESHTDESWALSLLEELQSEEEQQQKKSLPDTETDFSRLNSQAMVGQFYEDLEYEGRDGSDNSYINLTAIKLKITDPPATPELTVTDPAVANCDASAPLLAAQPAPATGRPAKGTPPPGSPATIAPDTELAPATALLQAIGSTPVEMEAQQFSRNWRTHLLWACLSLLAAAVLAAQLVWLNFDHLSQRPGWRFWFSQVCPLAGCDLNPMLAPELIKTSNLIVRTHPQREKALAIDCILLNTAGFSQPFPNFQLSFSNLQGKILGEREFTPAEYLSGELTGATSMPSGQPVHIALEIIDPGADAVNYSASIPLPQ